MIGVDWGTTSFRAFRIAPDGTIRDRRTALKGLLNVPDKRFADTLREEIGPWLAAGEDHVLLSGMIGSRQGWMEAPYLPCPAGASEVAAGLVEIEFDWGQVKLVPGLSAVDEAGVAEVMRGEETQILGLGALMPDFAGVAILPGTHSKWVSVEGRRIDTIESLAKDGHLSAVQRGFHEKLGSQCGYCTPGYIMASAGLLRRNRNPSDAEIREALGSNICRCTGYVKIIEAVKHAAALCADGLTP